MKEHAVNLRGFPFGFEAKETFQELLQAVEINVNFVYQVLKGTLLLKMSCCFFSFIISELDK